MAAEMSQLSKFDRADNFALAYCQVFLGVYSHAVVYR
jgi:hypothetical protein